MKKRKQVPKPDNNKLMEEFLANGGVIKKLPTIKPDEVPSIKSDIVKERLNDVINSYWLQ